MNWFKRRQRRKPTPTLYVMRLEDMVRLHPEMSTDERCCLCQSVVGIYPSGQQVFAQYGRANVRIVCSRCETPTHAMLAPGAEFEPFESVRRS